MEIMAATAPTVRFGDQRTSHAAACGGLVKVLIDPHAIRESLARHGVAR
jgi:hypothetical protein